MPFYIKKPVTIEAVQYSKTKPADLSEFFAKRKADDQVGYDPAANRFYIKTLEGDMLICEGDYVIRGVRGEFYPCKADIFSETYDLMDC
mgnify:CR=1 FL=1